MLFRTHIIFFIFIFLLIFNKINAPFIFFFIGLISTVIPDIDSNNSRVGRKPLFKILTAFNKHRGFFHSLFFGILFFSFIYFFVKKEEIAFAFALGYFLHLFLDSLTKQGINLFWPFNLKIKGFIRSGGKIELIIFIVLSFLILVFFFRMINSYF